VIKSTVGIPVTDDETSIQFPVILSFERILLIERIITLTEPHVGQIEGHMFLVSSNQNA
jgi:hypothetical protein